MSTHQSPNISNNHELPLDRYKKSLLYLLLKHNVIIVVAETGSGKSTRIPSILYNAGYSMIGVTQPRRVAVIQIAQTVADNLRCNLGSTVGYAIRFKNMTDPGKTMIKFLTEGVLVREMMIDPLLSCYSVIMIDEVHERNSNTDILLGLLKCVLCKRNDLKLILCSATMAVDSMYNFFSEDSTKPGVLCVKGRSYPIKIYHMEQPCPNYMDTCVHIAINIHEEVRLSSGNILIFLTGLDEIGYVCDKLIDYARMTTSRLDLRKLNILPFHASLTAEEISRVFNKTGRSTRSCIVSTNLAETSLTLPDIGFVIDCGFTKLRIFNHSSCVDSLVRVPISKSCAKQRAGRAGRTREGSVYRLYPRCEYDKLSSETTPELLRCSLEETIILLKSLGVENVRKFPLLSRLPKYNLVPALELLCALQAIDGNGVLTSLGDKMAELNLEPRLAKILVDQRSSSCTYELSRIVATLQIKDIFTKSRKYADSLWSNTDLIKVCCAEGDLLSYLNIINSFQANGKNQRWAEKRNLDYNSLLNALDVAEKLEQQMRRIGIKIASCKGRIEVLQQALAYGLFSNAAYLHPCGDYKTIMGEKTVHIHPHSIYNEVVDRPKHVLYVELLSTTKCFMRHVMSIDTSSLVDAAPHFYTFATNLEMMRNKT